MDQDGVRVSESTPLLRKGNIMLTTQQVADILGVSTRRVRYMIAAGQLDAQEFNHTWAIEEASVTRAQELQRAQRAWAILGITRRLWGAWWLSDIDELETLVCPVCGATAYSPAGETEYSNLVACPNCEWTGDTESMSV